MKRIRLQDIERLEEEFAAAPPAKSAALVKKLAKMKRRFFSDEK